METVFEAENDTLSYDDNYTLFDNVDIDGIELPF